MRLVDIKTEVQDLINFTSGVADQDFTDAQIVKAINLRYALEVSYARLHGKRTWFMKVASFTWPAGATTLTLPPEIDQAAVVEFTDITDSDPGPPLTAAHWLDNRTLQWGSTSPGSARTLRAKYLGRPAEMVNDADEPDLIPPDQRMVLVWSTAVYLRQKADEDGVPQNWLGQLNEERLNFWKYVSRSRPMLGAGAPYDVVVDYIQAAQDGSSINQDNN